MKHLKLIFTALLLILNSLFLIQNSSAQCLQIESILVDACVAGGGCSSSSGPCTCEGRNEMVLIKISGTAINTTSLTPNWPNNSFKGWKQNANTASDVATLNATIIKCGFLKEPVGNILPANSEVLIITSWDMCTGANSFANLQDTLIVLFQDTNNFQGHFVNQNNGGTINVIPTGPNITRTLTFNYLPLACTESVTYMPNQLVNNLGTYGGSSSQNDGATVLFDPAGNPTYVNNGCQAPYIPILVTTTAPSTVCVNGTANISGTVSGPAVSYSWTTTGTGTVSVSTGTLSGTGSTTVNTTYTPGAGESGTITFTLTAQGKCSLAVVTNTVAISVTPLPSPSIISSVGDTVCSGSSTVLSVSAASGTTYSWNPGGVSGTSFTVAPVSQTIYTVDATNACATVSATFTVSVHALPIVAILNDSICIGASGTLNASGASTYTWSGGSTGSTLNNSPVTTTQFTVTGTDFNGCINSSTGIIYVNPLPTLTVNSPSVCPGNTATLTAGGATTFTWSTTQNGNTISVSPGSTTSYTVAGTDLNGCSNFIISTVTIFNPNVTANNSTICPGNSATLNASGASTYTWSTGSNGTSITVTPAVNTSYTVVGTDANGCKDSTVATVTIVNTLTVTAVATNTAVCQGSSTPINGNGANTYTWSPAGSLSSSIGTTVTASPTVTTTYTVIGSSGSCSDTSTVTVNVNNLPTITANASAPSVCIGGSVTLSGGGGLIYIWTGGVSNGIPFNPASTQTYTVAGIGVNGCSNFAAITVTVNPLPTVTVNSSSICPGASATLTAAGATTYTWSTTATGNPISVNPVSNTSYTVVGTDVNGCMNQAVSNVSINSLPTITVNSPSTCPSASTTLTATGGLTYSWSTSQTGTSITVPGTVTSYTVTGTGANGCTNTAVANVTLLPAPTAQTISGVPIICEGQNTNLSVNQSGGYTYSWSGPSGPSTGTLITTGIAGVYTLTATNACGSATSTFTVVASLPEAAFSTNISGGQAPVNIVFTNISTGTALSNYWNFANGDTSHQLNTSETYTVAGSYNATLIVTDTYGCTDTASINIVVTDIPSVLIIPNIFSPNADNINDVFMITANDITNFTCKIYDRWGLLLYEWFDLHGGWDGRNATDGTYYYLLTYTDNKGIFITKPGFLQLIR